MSKIAGITLSYDSDEDRVHVATRLAGGNAMRFWLTQRLARRLVAALANHLEQVEGIPVPTVRKAMMTIEQAQAVATIKPTAPVKTGAEAPVHLVKNITLGLAAEMMEVRFDSGIDCKPSIVLDRTQARQWLSMLHRQFVAAQWPLDVWPGWLTDAGAEAAVPATRH